MLENKTFDEINVGDTASLTRALRKEDLETWAAVTGNRNLMRDFEVAARQGLDAQTTASGTWAGGLFGTLVGNQLPGVGSVVRSAHLSYERPLAFGSLVTATVTVTSKNVAQNSVIVEFRCVDKQGTACVTGVAEVIAPKQKVREPLRELPSVHLRREDRFLNLLKRCKGQVPTTTAVVHPVKKTHGCGHDRHARAVRCHLWQGSGPRGATPPSRSDLLRRFDRPRLVGARRRATAGPEERPEPRRLHAQSRGGLRAAVRRRAR
jgi:acyl dehydratase